MNGPDLNPKTGRPYRLGTWRRMLARATQAARRDVHDQLARRADDAAAERKRQWNDARLERLARRGPQPARRVVFLTDPQDARKPRDRSLRGKDRIRARKAARRAGGQS